MRPSRTNHPGFTCTCTYPISCSDTQREWETSTPRLVSTVLQSSSNLSLLLEMSVGSTTCKLLLLSMLLLMLADVGSGWLWAPNSEYATTPSPPPPPACPQGNNWISWECMDSICEVEGCREKIGECKDVMVMGMNSRRCGPYQINQTYWIDCGRPGISWQTCTKTMGCSKRCVRNYMSRYARKCTEHSTVPMCKDYARIHKGGPLGCRKATGNKEKELKKYWLKVKAQCSNELGRMGDGWED